MNLTILLYNSGYPPQWDEEVFNKIMEQAENFKKYNNAVNSSSNNLIVENTDSINFKYTIPKEEDDETVTFDAAENNAQYNN